MDHELVDAYNDYCYGPRLLSHVRLLPRASTRRKITFALRRSTTMAIAAAMVGTIALVAQPPQPVAAAALSQHHTAVVPHRAKIIGKIVTPKAHPLTCPPSPPSPPPSSFNTVAYVAEPSQNAVEEINEQTGALIGSPITVGTSPEGIAYWRPFTSSRQDPKVVVANNGSSTVSIIDALTNTLLNTVSLPAGSAPTAVAASPSNSFAVVVDHTGKVSIIYLPSGTDEAELNLTSTAGALSSIAFSASGSYFYVTDPSEGKIFVVEYIGGTYTVQTTYTNLSIAPTGIATDLSNTTSSTLLVGNAQSSSGSLLNFSDASGTLSAPATVKTFASTVPGAISLNPGSTTAYVAMTGTKTINQVTVSSGATTAISAASAFTAVGPIGLSADGSTLLAADTGSATVQELSTTSQLGVNSTSTSGAVDAIAPAPATNGSWDAYVVVNGAIDVVNTGTDSVTQTITDSNGPVAIAVNPRGSWAYVANTDSISVIYTPYIGTSHNPLVATITGIQGSEPNTPSLNGIAVDPSMDTLLVTDAANGAVDVVDLNSQDGSSFETVVNRIGLLGSGIGSTLVQPQGGIAFSPDGLYAYVTEAGSSDDGVTVLKLASSTTTGYSYSAVDENLQETYGPGPTTVTMASPSQITINPDDETAYVAATDTTNGGLWAFPIQTSGQLASGTAQPLSLGTAIDGVAYSPEDDSAFVTDTASFDVSSVSETYQSPNYTSATVGYPTGVAVTPDGLYLGVLSSYQCSAGENRVSFYNAETGVDLADVTLSSMPTSIAFAPQSAPQYLAVQEVRGGGTNPAEAAIGSGMNDVVTSGTPSDAPGATAGVDTATGAYSMSLDSLGSIPDIGIPLDMTATYDSADASTLGLLGYGWQDSYGITATQNAHNAGWEPCAITATWEDGAQSVFLPSALGPFTTCPTTGYEPASWVQAKVTFASSCGTGSCYVFTRDSTLKYYVDESTGELVKVTDAHGNTETITWGSHTACAGATSTEPCQVTGPSGVRTLTFSYPASGTGTCPSWIVSCVVVTDPLGRTVTYGLDSRHQLQQVTLANASVSESYVLEYTNSNLMTVWWDPQNNSNHNNNTAYATNVTWSGTKVTQVTGPTMANAGTSMTATYVPTTTFTYDDFDNRTGNGTVLIDNPNFNQSPSMYGANQTLDTYQGWMLTSSVQGYGPLAAYGSYTLAPQPSEIAVPMRDILNLMPNETMNALAGSCVGTYGTNTGTGYCSGSSENSQYDQGVTQNTYDASANLLESIAPSDNTPTQGAQGNTTTSQYNGLNEVTVSVDAIGYASTNATVVAAHTTTNTYNASGDLLTTTSPATEDWLSNPETSSYYNSNGTLCASRTADEVAAYGVLSSCSATHATTLAYDSSGDQTKSTDPLGNVTESAFDADGDTCATLSPDGYANGQTLTSCPSTATNNETVTLARSQFLAPTKVVSPANAAGGTTWTYFDHNGNQIASVSPMGNPSTCNPLTTSTCPYTTYASFDAMGDPVSATSQTSASGTKGPTTTSYFDPDGTQVAAVSPEGNINTPSSYEQATVPNSLGDAVSQTPASNLGSSCSVTSSTPCPNTSVTTYDPNGESTQTLTSKSDVGSAAPTTTASAYNPDSTGESATVPTTTSTNLLVTSGVNDQNGNQLESTSQINGTGTALAGSTTTYEPNGATCWTSPVPWTGSSAPSCDSPPIASGNQTTVDYYDASGNLVAVSGPGSNPYASGNTSGCNPLTTSNCHFTTYYTYDEDNHLLTTTQPLDYSGSSYPVTTDYYDNSGSLVAVTGAAGSPGTCNPLVTSTCTDTTYKTYDGAGRVTTITYTDGTPTVTFSYNNDGTRHQMVDGTGTTSYTYDDLGQLTQKTDGAANSVTYGYDTAGELICMSYPNSSSDTCATTGAGTTSPPNGDVTYTYDTFGRLASIVTWVTIAPSTYVTLTYGHDCSGSLYWISTGTSATSSPCTPSNQIPPAPPTVTSAVTTIYGYTNSLETSIATSTGNGATPLLGLTLGYNTDDLLSSSVPETNTTTLATDSYTYNASNQVATGPITGSTGGGSYAYTPVNDTGSPNTGSISADTTAFMSAAYSENGELCWTLGTSSSNACGSAPSGASKYTYDASGDRLTLAPGSGNSEAFGWEQASERLVCANTNGTTCSTSSPTSTTMVYAYNGDGERATLTLGTGSATTFVWDGLQQRVLSNGNQDFIYGQNPSSPVLQVTLNGSNPVVDLLCQDSNSNTRGIVQLAGGTGSYTGALVAYVDYDAYGNPITESGGSSVPGGLTATTGGYQYSVTALGFGSGYLDATGFAYLVNRFFDPTTGQFTSIDPVLNSTQSPFVYSQDNPISLTDPTGLRSSDEGTCFDGKNVGMGVLEWMQNSIYCYSLFPTGATVTSDFMPIAQDLYSGSGSLLHVKVSYEIGIRGKEDLSLKNLIKSAGVDSSGTLSIGNDGHLFGENNGPLIGSALQWGLSDYDNAAAAGAMCPGKMSWGVIHGCIAQNGSFRMNFNLPKFSLHGGQYEAIVKPILSFDTPTAQTTGWVKDNVECLTGLIQIPNDIWPPDPISLVSTAAACV